MIILELQLNFFFKFHRTFICLIHAFGLEKKLCQEFLQKQFTIASLPPSKFKIFLKFRIARKSYWYLLIIIDQEKLLVDHMNNLYGQTDIAKWAFSQELVYFNIIFQDFLRTCTEVIQKLNNALTLQFHKEQ